MAMIPTWIYATAFPGNPLEAFLVPEILSPQVKANRKTFYYGINMWSQQWADFKPFTRWRFACTTIGIDKKHKISTLIDCINGTVAAYQFAANTLLGVAPNPSHGVSTAGERVIYQGLGHGARTKDESHQAAADFGCQLGPFGQHEFRASPHTFEVYRQVRDNGFDVAIVDKSKKKLTLMPDAVKARHLLSFDGLCQIRAAITPVVKRVRLVTCNIGGDKDFLEQLAWVLGRPRPGQGMETKVVIEAYDRQVDARKKPTDPNYRIGVIEDREKPKDVKYDGDNAYHEVPEIHVASWDPMGTQVPDPKDPLPISPSNAAKLGDCHSVSHLIPPKVLGT